MSRIAKVILCETGAFVIMVHAAIDEQVTAPAYQPYDPRSVCNLMLDEAESSHIQITNLVLQKLLYFAHARHLIEHKRPLVSGYFEAWRYGPVHPGAYTAFKSAGSMPISFRAEREHPITGARSSLDKPSDSIVLQLARTIINQFGGMSATRIIDVSHAPGSPWDVVVSREKSSQKILGLRIPDDLIVDRFKYHKISIGEVTEKGYLGEDSPFE